MFFLNFGWTQLLILAGAASAFTVALYLLDRSRRRLVVATLRFWKDAIHPAPSARQKRVQQPLSLALQLIGTLLLLIALAQPRIGNPLGKSGYHVLVLETSAWMRARLGRAALMDEARRRAHQWLRAVPAGDPVMLVRADALATPVTAFETDHARVDSAITASEPGDTTLDIAEALLFAKRAQTLQNGRGEIAFIGSGRIRDRAGDPVFDGRGLRVSLIPDAIENWGIRRISMKRASEDQALWNVLVTVRNYGTRMRPVALRLALNNSPFAAKPITLGSGAEQETEFTLRAPKGGLVEARLSPEDGFADDDRASLIIPPLPSLRVVIYTSRPDALRPLFAANSRVDAQFRNPSQYQPDDQALTILDGLRPSVLPHGDSIWINPSANQSPIRIRKIVDHPHELRWLPNHPLSAGLRAHDVRLVAASIFTLLDGDIPVAETNDGPVIVARPGNGRSDSPKLVVIGFDPGEPVVRNELSTPLVFANILRWINPESFRQSEFSAQSAGVVSLPLDPNVDSSHLRIVRDDGGSVPFTVSSQQLHFFAGARENVNVTEPNRELHFALTLPEMWDRKWEPPKDALRGLPRSLRTETPPEIWPYLVVAAAFCFLAEWFLFARHRRGRLKEMPMPLAQRRAS